jgi:hypothetical protein
MGFGELDDVLSERLAIVRLRNKIKELGKI